MMYRTKGKAVILAVAIAVSMVVMGILLNGMQERLQLESLDHEIRQEAAELPGVLQAAADETVGNEETFDAIYQSKAESVAFMARNDVGFEASDAKMREYKDLLKVDNIMVVARDGQVVAKAADAKANFAYDRFNALRVTFDTGKASDAVEIELPERGWLERYYACALDDDSMVVIENSPSELRELVDGTSSTQGYDRRAQRLRHGGFRTGLPGHVQPRYRRGGRRRP